MSELSQSPSAARPFDPGPVRPFDASLAAIGVSLAIVAGTALLGLAAGYVWSQVAPRALLVIVSPGAAGLVHTETAAFIAADLTFCLIGLAGGVLSGALGYLLGVRRYGPLAMVAVLVGALAAALLTRWVGQQAGLASFHHLLATLPAGRHLLDPLTLRATGAAQAGRWWPAPGRGPTKPGRLPRRPARPARLASRSASPASTDDAARLSARMTRSPSCRRRARGRRAEAAPEGRASAARPAPLRLAGCFPGSIFEGSRRRR
jgi:hypothetical protein